MSDILKSQWEKYTDPIELTLPQLTLLVAPYTHAPIQKITLLSDGCANSNYKITFADTHPPLCLRLYQRDHTALRREMLLYPVVVNKIPVPRFLHTDASCQLSPVPYALLDWIEGITLRQVLLKDPLTNLTLVMHQAAAYISTLASITYPQGGFFSENGRIQPFAPQEDLLRYGKDCLDAPAISSYLGAFLCTQIIHILENNHCLLPKMIPANLTHGDFDASNILVNNNNGKWQITALLDWEFAFAGSFYFDMGTFLRYRDHLPSSFCHNFIGSLKECMDIDDRWPKIISLCDAVNLLSVLRNSSPTQRPNVFADIKERLSFYCAQF